MKFDYDQFMYEVNRGFLSQKSEDQRYGQFIMNYLSKHYSDIQVPEVIDPFYDNSKVPNLMNYLYTVSMCNK